MEERFSQFVESEMTGDYGASESHMRLLYDSYYRLLGKPLIAWDGASPLFPLLFEAPFYLLSHGIEADPILNFGNRNVLRLWEMDWKTLIQTPSRETAEPMLQSQRELFLREVREKGYVSNYRGTRISSSGNRFEIVDVIVWNLFDSNQVLRGQAAVFERVNAL